MLKVESLPENTKNLFEKIRYHPELSALTLVGGTAIALLVAHRSSMDLDFCTFEDRLPSYQINRFIQSLKNDGHQVFDATEPNQKAQFKINTGKTLDDYARDYVIDSVKVQMSLQGLYDFFAKEIATYQQLKSEATFLL
jgi:flagellar hook-basal body complex protein FliE